jgi:hypothetical protein
MSLDQQINVIVSKWNSTQNVRYTLIRHLIYLLFQNYSIYFVTSLKVFSILNQEKTRLE